MSLSQVWGRLQRVLQHGRPDRAVDLVGRLLDGTPEEQHAAHRALRAILPRLTACALSPTRKGVIRRLGLAPPTAQARIGQMDFPTAWSEQSRFVAARVGLTSGKDRLLPEGLPSRTRHAVADALAGVRAVCGVDQAFEVVFEVPIDGQSCGLAVALAAQSQLQMLPLPERIVATGRVLPDGRVDSVYKLPEKLALRAEARPGSTLLVPADVIPPHEQIIAVRSLAHAQEVLGHPEQDLDKQIVAVRERFRGGAWLEAAAQAGLLLDSTGLQDAERVELLTILLCAANHTGRGERAAELVTRLDGLLGTQLLPGLLAPALASCLVAAVDAFRADLAPSVLDSVTGHSWQRADLVHLRGAQALLAVYEDRLAEAVQLRRQNCDDAFVDELPRCLGDLADVLRRSGLLDEARTVIERALSTLRTTGRRHGYQRQTQPFLHLHAARIYRACGDPQRALAHLESAHPGPGPDPQVRLRLEQALLISGLPALASLWAECASLHGSVVFQALYLRARVEAGDPAAGAELARVMNLWSTPPAELCRRLPY